MSLNPKSKQISDKYLSLATRRTDACMTQVLLYSVILYCVGNGYCCL